ncbi:MAG: trehalose-phosphatase [Deltaproteobacteria bacterium]|nr:trehalose-phosphatase [Deltaproteobacteria bacterium]
MTDLLAAAQAPVLAHLADARTLLAFDFDGTLAPIVADREQAAMRARTEQLLTRLCALYPCAVISGRSRDDLAGRLGRAPVPHLIGNHGIEPADDELACARVVRRARPLLALAVRRWPGMEIEDKRLSLAVHYRHAVHRDAARAAIDRMVAVLPVRLRVIPGKLVVNLVPAHAPHKGDALVAVRTAVAADMALYLGDDDTDEDVFRLDQPQRLVGVRVGRRAGSAARYFVRAQRDVDTLLERLIALRTAVADR